MNPTDFTAETIAYARELRELYRAAEQRAVRFRLLVEMGRDLVSARDTEALLRIALVRATTFSGYDAGCVLLFAADGALVIRSEITIGAAEPNLSLRTNLQEQAHNALQEGRILLVDLPDEHHPQRESRIYLPLVASDGQKLGVLLLSGEGVAHTPDADDLDALQLLAGQLAASLQSTQLHEEKGQLVRQLVEREQRLAELIERIMRAQEEERRRVAYELHDGLAQMVLGVLQQLHTLADRYHPRAPASRQALARAVEMAQATVSEARRVIAGLRPTVLDDFGLVTALHLQAAALQAEGWEVSFEEALNGARLAPAAETALFRIAQEALTNVRKHAGATRVRLALHYAGDAVRLSIQDWGHGFLPDQQTGQVIEGTRVGLSSMQERVALFGGQWRLESGPGQGTLVEVTLPLHNDASGGSL